MITSTKGAFVVTGLHTESPKYFWKGTELTDVKRMVAHVDEDTHHVKLHVENTTTFDVQYVEMVAAGIKVKKGG